MEYIEMLNRVYEPICDQCNKIQNHLKLKGYITTKGFYNNHSIKDKNGSWFTEQYPIPVITVDQLCDIGIDVNFIFIETKMKIETALKYDFNELLRYKFEVYGIEDYLNDFYNDSLDIKNITEKLRISDEIEIGICFELQYDCINQVIEVIKELNKIEAYI